MFTFLSLQFLLKITLEVFEFVIFPIISCQQGICVSFSVFVSLHVHGIIRVHRLFVSSGQSGYPTVASFKFTMLLLACALTCMSCKRAKISSDSVSHSTKFSFRGLREFYNFCQRPQCHLVGYCNNQRCSDHSIPRTFGLEFSLLT